jgi:hypothetical protein
MRERSRDLIPSRDEQQRALAALWVTAVVGAGAYLVYDASVPGADLPLSPVPALFLALVGATVAVTRAD